jgi:hypothetical protein
LIAAQILALTGVSSSAFSEDKKQYFIVFESHAHKRGLIINIDGAIADPEATGEEGRVVPRAFRMHRHHHKANQPSTKLTIDAWTSQDHRQDFDIAQEGLQSEKPARRAGQAAPAAGPARADLLIGGMVLPGENLFSATQVTTVVQAMQIASGFGAGVELQMTPNSDTEGVTLSYSPTDHFTVATNFDRRISGGENVGSNASSGFGLGGIGGPNSTEFDGGVTVTYHVWFGGGSAQ